MPRVLPYRLLCIALVGLTTLAAAPAYAADALPQLPNPQPGRCVDASRASVAGRPWAQQMLLPDQVWPLATGTGVRVAVLDGGVHAGGQLAGAVSGSGTDCTGHGTFVASLIAARPAAGTGFAGLAPGAYVLSVPTDDATAADGIRTALAQHAGVICLSIVVTRDTPALRSAVAAASAQGVPIVTPAFGDSGTPVPVSVLRGLPGVLTVAGIDPDGKDVKAVPAGAAIDVYAPGASVVGLGPRGGEFVGGGAGVAAGFVAGTVALLRQYRPGLSAVQLKQQVVATAYQQETATVAGTIDPFAALTARLGVALPRAVPQAVAAPVAAPGPGGRAGALTVLVISALFSAIVAGAGAAVRRAGRRGWRPATGRPPASPSPSAPGTAGDERSAAPDRPVAGVA